MNILQVFPALHVIYGRLSHPKYLRFLGVKPQPNRHATKKGPGRKPLLRKRVAHVNPFAQA